MKIMKSKFKRKKSLNSIIFGAFIIVNVLMLIISIYTLYFSPSSPFTAHRMSHDTTFWIGALKNVALLSGLWIFIDVIFSIFFYFKSRFN